jgi:hypothetical protein
MATQELRLTSNGTGTFNYLGGLYFADARNDRSFTRGPTLSVANWSGRADTQFGALPRAARSLRVLSFFATAGETRNRRSELGVACIVLSGCPERRCHDSVASVT